MPITLNHSNIGVQYNTGSNYIIETVKSDLYLRNEIYDTIVSNNLQTAPVTPIVSIQEGSNIYAVESYTYSGTANTADFTRVFPKNTTCDILIVGGGGGGGSTHGGGGGAGQLVFIHQANLNGTYNIKIGKGGIGGSINATSQPTKGSNSEFGSVIAEGGGANGGNLLKDGGSGAGGDGYDNVSGKGLKNTTIDTFLSGTIYSKGNDGGSGPSSGIGHGGGGGGAGTAGTDGGIGQTTTGLTITGNGGDGLSGISEINYDFYTKFGNYGNLESDGKYYFAGGGGGGAWGNVSGTYTPNGGNGGKGGGSKGGIFDEPTITYNPLPALNNTGSGGGGGAPGGGAGSSGGSGIVIIRYLLGTIPTNNLLTSEPTVISPVMTESIRTFVHSGGTEAQTTHTITVGQNTICDILIVGGGGGGGFHTGGGGGAGGYYFQTNTIIASGTYIINVGKGGNGSANNNARGSNGNDTTFNGITAKGGGGGASDNDPTGNSGGSGGGADWNGTPGADTDANTDGNAGGVPINITGQYYGSGGGGAGSSGFTNGNGGTGKSNNITGTNTFYAAGGGGGRNEGSNWSGIGGSGIGGNGGNGNTAATSGLNGTGSGGGGSGFVTGPSAANGGSGIVIIKFKSIVGAGILDGTTHKRLTYVYEPIYPSISADNTNLKVWYKFDNPTNLGKDEFNQRNLTNTNVSTTNDLIGTSASFTNETYLSINNFNLNFDNTITTTGISFSFWFNLDVGSEYYGHLFTWGTHNSSEKFALMRNNLELKLAIIQGISTQNEFNILAYNTWIHLVINIDTSRVLRVYQNTILIFTLTLTPSAYSGLTTSSGFTIGRATSVNIHDFKGGIEDFRIYDKVLTSTEISQLYNISTQNTYTLNFPVPTIADINNNSNIVLRGAYDISLSNTNSSIIPKSNQYIPKPTTFASDLLSIRYNLLNPVLDISGAQLTYNTSNTNVYHMGSVGIGTKSPEYHLDVRGSVNAKSYYLNGRQINEPISELGLSEGMIAQVRHLTYTQMEIKNNTGWDAINDNLTTGFVIAITPKSNLSKILVNIIVHIGLSPTADSRWWGIKLYRKIGSGDWTEVTGPNGTETGSAAATAGTPVWISYTMTGTEGDYVYKITNVTGTYLDSPNTTATVYYTAYWNQRIGDNPSATGNIWLNRAESHGDAYRPAPSSSWTASEIWYG
jgi:hypothetical protein